MQYYAHSNKDKDGNYLSKDKWQTLEEHSLNVANKTRDFAEKFGLGSLGFDIGLYHDLGKSQVKMIERLEGSKIKVTHSSQGAINLAKEFKDELAIKIIKEVIASHHGGLKNFGSRIDTDDCPTTLGFLQRPATFDTEFEKYLKSLIIDSQQTLDVKKLFEKYVLIKMLHSCLIDADFLDTENFIEPKNRMYSIDWKKANEDLEKKLSSFLQDSHINKIRTEFRKDIVAKADFDRGIYSITAPTGSGKTLASLSYALKHLIANKMDGIVYASPRISLIKQNAEVIKNILGKENVLEYHSSLIPENGSENSDLSNLQLLSCENFDYPFVCTTFNQLFNAFFKSTNSINRRLHNLVNKVILIDESHLIPSDYLDAIIPYLKTMNKMFNCTIIFISATPFDYSLIKSDNAMMNIDTIELVSDVNYFMKNTKRVNINNLGKIEKTNLIEMIEKEDSCLTIVNKRISAQEIFEKICHNNKFHLSTFMCKEHINETIEKIKKCAFNCSLISTSVVEVGMDFDFRKGFCELKNIPSIWQSSGRVNREGKRNIEDFNVFRLNQEEPSVSQKKEISYALSTLAQIPNIGSLEAIHKYNEIFVNASPDTRNKEGIYETCGKLEFRKVDEIFQMINVPTTPVLIKYNKDAVQLIGQIKFAKDLNNRLLQLYVVSLYNNDLKNLLSRGYITKKETLDKVIYYVVEFFGVEKTSCYSPTIGLVPNYSINPIP